MQSEGVLVAAFEMGTGKCSRFSSMHRIYTVIFYGKIYKCKPGPFPDFLSGPGNEATFHLPSNARPSYPGAFLKLISTS